MCFSYKLNYFEGCGVEAISKSRGTNLRKIVGNRNTSNSRITQKKKRIKIFSQ